MRRTAPPSKPYGRYAIGLRPSAEIRSEHDQFWIVDMGSLNGTYVNREPVESAVLRNGDDIQIGKFRLVFLSGPTTD